MARVHAESQMLLPSSHKKHGTEKSSMRVSSLVGRLFVLCASAVPFWQSGLLGSSTPTETGSVYTAHKVRFTAPLRALAEKWVQQGGGWHVNVSVRVSLTSPNTPYQLFLSENITFPIWYLGRSLDRATVASLAQATSPPFFYAERALYLSYDFEGTEFIPRSVHTYWHSGFSTITPAALARLRQQPQSVVLSLPVGEYPMKTVARPSEQYITWDPKQELDSAACPGEPSSITACCVATTFDEEGWAIETAAKQERLSEPCEACNEAVFRCRKVQSSARVFFARDTTVRLDRV